MSADRRLWRVPMSSATDAPSDADLARAAQGGEAAALGLLLARHRASMLAVATGVLHHRADAEDAVQEAAVVALLHIERLRSPSAVGAWLRTVTRNAGLARLRRRREHAVDTNQLHGVASAEPDPAEFLDGRATRDWMWAALGRLPSEQRLVVILRHLTGLTAYQDIANVLQIPVGTVRSQLSTARRKLADALYATADTAHDDVTALARRHRQAAVESLAAAERGTMAEALAEYWSGDLTSSWPSGRTAIGHDYVVQAVQSTIADGVGHRLVDVVAGAGLVLWDMDLLNPPFDPLHCPPGALWVLKVDGDQVVRARMLHRPRHKHRRTVI